MPNRILRAPLLTSVHWNKATWPAQALFVRLVTLADDYGCFEADPFFLSRVAFPFGDPLGRPVKADLVGLWLDSLQSADLLHRYTDGKGKALLQLRRWDEDCRAKPKFELPKDDDRAVRMSARLLESYAVWARSRKKAQGSAHAGTSGQVSAHSDTSSQVSTSADTCGDVPTHADTCEDGGCAGTCTQVSASTRLSPSPSPSPSPLGKEEGAALNGPGPKTPSPAASVTKYAALKELVAMDERARKEGELDEEGRARLKKNRAELLEHQRKQARGDYSV